jgi:hypothetical protein
MLTHGTIRQTTPLASYTHYYFHDVITNVMKIAHEPIPLCYSEFQVVCLYHGS